MDDVKIPEFQGFLAGVLGSDKQYFSDVNKQEELRKKMLENAKRQQETREFMDNVPLRNAEDALKMDIARRKLPMVQEMLNADLGGKKAEIASKLSSARLHDTQADTSEYSINATRLDAIHQILKKLPPDQALAMRIKFNPVMQQLMNKMVQRPAGEFVGSNELEATAGAGINPPKTQQMIAQLQNKLEIAERNNNSREAATLTRVLGMLEAANIRAGAQGSKVDRNSWQSRLSRALNLSPETRINTLENLYMDAPDDIPQRTLEVLKKQIDADRRLVKSKPTNRAAGDTGGVDVGGSEGVIDWSELNSKKKK